MRRRYAPSGPVVLGPRPRLPDALAVRPSERLTPLRSGGPRCPTCGGVLCRDCADTCHGCTYRTPGSRT